MNGQHPADLPAEAWAFAKHQDDLPRDYRRNAPVTISALPYADRVPAMARRDSARREAFLDAYRIPPDTRSTAKAEHPLISLALVVMFFVVFAVIYRVLP